MEHFFFFSVEYHRVSSSKDNSYQKMISAIPGTGKISILPLMSRFMAKLFEFVIVMNGQRYCPKTYLLLPLPLSIRVYCTPIKYVPLPLNDHRDPPLSLLCSVPLSYDHLESSLQYPAKHFFFHYTGVHGK
jgi:hypothetical protein